MTRVRAHILDNGKSASNKNLSYRWQTARPICAICNGVADVP